MATIVLALAGLAGLVGGGLAVRRLRGWQPRIRPDLGEYDPGPDAIDWLEAGGLLVAGALLLTLSLIA